MTIRHFTRVGAAALALLLPPAAGALPVISEVLYDATGSDDGMGFVEIFGAPGTSVDGWVIEGINGANGAEGPAIALSGVIPADGLFVVADRTGTGLTFVAGADLLDDFDFQNGPDSVVLRSDTTIFDALGYGSFGVGDVFAGEGSPAPDAPAGSSLARRFADVDSGDNASDFEVLATPSPGTAPRAVPEPALASLLAVVGLCVARQRKRCREWTGGRLPPS